MFINKITESAEMHLRTALRENQKKKSQFQKVVDFSQNLTSQDTLDVIVELYDDNIVRYLIEGTRSSMTLTVNALTNEVKRKPRNVRPWFIDATAIRVEKVL